MMQPEPAAIHAVKTVSILGSTGSIGRSTVDLILSQRDKFSVAVLTGGKNLELLVEQAKKLRPRHAVIADETLYMELKQALSGTGIEVAAGDQAIVDAAAIDTDWTMSAIVGIKGLLPTLEAIKQGKRVALANKESLVSAGSLMIQAVDEAGCTLLPVDSEHNAVFQVFDRRNKDSISRIILTASGGPFLHLSRDELKGITREQALRHPTWSMGEKISIDSATMMNKSLEIIEASYFFNLKRQKIDVLIHPQSIVHSMVEYADGSILAQMGASDMRTPIAHTLAWPERMPTSGKILDLTKNVKFEFEPIDIERFISIKLAYAVLDTGKNAPAILNAANEVAVEAFLAGRLDFSKIEYISEKVLQVSEIFEISSIDAVLAADVAARKLAHKAIAEL